MSHKTKVTTQTLLRLKEKKQPIAMITAYDFPTAKMADQVGADIILVGDTLGMVVLGYDSTIPVTLADMIHHTKAVTRAAKSSLVVTDLPFLTAHLGKDQILHAAGRLMQEAGAYAVKVEGCSKVIENIQTLVDAGIPVMGHLGLTPQCVNQLGGYFIQGKNIDKAKQILEEAKRLEEIGVFSLVLECVPEELAQLVANELTIPVIGIGAGRFCDGQVLVLHDLLQIGDWHPSFVKVYEYIGEAMMKGMKNYIDEVRAKVFPKEEHVFHLSSSLMDQLTEVNKRELEK